MGSWFYNARQTHHTDKDVHTDDKKRPPWQLFDSHFASNYCHIFLTRARLFQPVSRCIPVNVAILCRQKHAHWSRVDQCWWNWPYTWPTSQNKLTKRTTATYSQERKECKGRTDEWENEEGHVNNIGYENEVEWTLAGLQSEQARKVIYRWKETHVQHI